MNTLYSEARRINANLGQTDMQNKLEVLLTPEGTPSSLYPRDLNTLFQYPGKVRLPLAEHDNGDRDR